MNLIVLKQEDFSADNDNHAVLFDERFLHIQKILQSKVGELIRVGQLNGLLGVGVIKQINNQSVTLDTTFDQPPPPKLPLTIILALPRPKMIRRIFRSVVELGVSHLIIINSYKVEKSFWSSPALNEKNMQSYLFDGLQQAKDTVPPSVSIKKLFKPFVEDELPALISGTLPLLAHPGIGQPCPHSLNQPITLAIGPEGGFSDYEANKFIASGFDAIHLGPRILRVENALSSLVSKLYY